MDNNTTEVSWLPLFLLGEDPLKGSWSIVSSPCQFYSYALFVHYLFEAMSKFRKYDKTKKGIFFSGVSYIHLAMQINTC